jgi:hypothetical protein
MNLTHPVDYDELINPALLTYTCEDEISYTFQDHKIIIPVEYVQGYINVDRHIYFYN